ncbi:siroheme synthase CysG, partial [Klebsiella pneumoniae]|uniref:NAD(P)-dependent oxidoreductase n=1 Tax=Klebsiella pneumoniae TaxID=573 RepID=UPI001A33DA13
LGKTFDPQQLDDVFLAIAATDDNALNAAVFAEADKRRVLVNVVDDQPRCSFIFPSIIDRSPLVVAVSSSGQAPALARLLREKLEAMLPQHLGKLAQLGGSLRQRVKQRFSSLGARRRFWERLFAHDRLAQSLANDDAALAERQLEQLFSERPEDRGEVVLVGAGPGDAGLLTLKGLQQIQ